MKKQQMHLAVLMTTFAMAGLLSSCAPPAPTEVDVRVNNARIVSLNPCTDAILVDVAYPGQVLALSHYSHDPASSSIPHDVASQFPVTGGTVEEILALDPDMVLASSFLPPATANALRDLDIPFRTFASPTSVSQNMAQVHYIGKLAGQSSSALSYAGMISEAIRRNAAPPGHTPISTVLWQPGEIVPGEGALISELMREAGFSSHSAALGMGQADYLPLEVLLAHPPELLLVAGNSRGQLHPALQQLENTRVETLDPSLLYCGGPTIIRAMERLAEIRTSMRS